VTFRSIAPPRALISRSTEAACLTRPFRCNTVPAGHPCGNFLDLDPAPHGRQPTTAVLVPRLFTPVRSLAPTASPAAPPRAAFSSERTMTGLERLIHSGHFVVTGEI